LPFLLKSFHCLLGHHFRHFIFIVRQCLTNQSAELRLRRTAIAINKLITRLTAEKIKSDRILALQHASVKQWDKVRKSSTLLLDYLKDYENAQTGVSQKTLKNRHDMRLKVEEYANESNQHIVMLPP